MIMHAHRRGPAKVHSRLKYSLVAGTAALVAVSSLVAVFGPLAPAGGTASAPTSPSGSAAQLLTPSQTAFNGTTGGWVGSNAVLSSLGTSDATTSALKVIADATSRVSAWSAMQGSGTPTPVTPGRKYVGDATVEVTNPSPWIGDALVFFNAAGSVLTAVWGQAASPTPSTSTTLPEVVGMAPSNAASVGLGVIAWTAKVGQVFLVRSPVLTLLTSPATAPAVVGPLHTSGNHVVQANGQPVTLRGVVMPGLEQQGTVTRTGVSQQAVIEAKDWGANFVRVPLGEQFWLSSNCDYVASYVATVDQVVQWITSLGMVALLDLHTNTVSGCTAGGQHDMADEAQAPTFWSELSSRYGNPSSPEYNPLVAFDLYNEPHNISDAVWLNGGMKLEIPGGLYQTAGMQQLYNVVRAAGSENLVFISGNNWASTPPSTLVKGANIVYAVHYYTCPTVPVSGCTNADKYDPAQDLNQWDPLSATEPVVVTEFGWPSQQSGTYNANVIDYAFSHGWGWSAFAWEDRQYPSDWDLGAGRLSDGTTEPSPSGMPVLLALAGGT
jgi:aryl-phospho-beta-D-glucosidase BglC (GH1 family)